MNRLDELINQYCPDGVEYRKLGDANGCNISTGKGVTKTDIVFDGEYDIVSGGKDSLGKIDIYNREGKNVTIARAGSAGLVLWHEKPFYLNDKCFSIIPKDDSINTKYLYYTLKNIEDKIIGMKSRGTVPTVNTQHIASIEIPVPPLPVQEEIVRILDKFTRLEQELEQELELRKKQYEYYRDKMLSLSDYDGEVKKCAFSDLCDIQNGFAFKSASFGKGASKVLKITNIGFDGNIITDNMVTIDKSDYPKTNFNSYEVHNGNIVIALSGATTGKISRSKSDDVFLLNQRTAKFLPHDDLDESYLYHYLSARVDKFFQMAGGGAQPNLSTTKIEEMNIVVPADINEQKRIASVLDKFSTLTEDISEGLPAEIKMRHQQYEYYRDKLLNFKRLEVA